MRIDQLQPRPSNAATLEIPVELLGSVRRHQAHLAELVATLRAAGLKDDMIDTSVRALVDSYAADLTRAIQAMTKAPTDA